MLFEKSGRAATQRMAPCWRQYPILQKGATYAIWPQAVLSDVHDDFSVRKRRSLPGARLSLLVLGPAKVSSPTDVGSGQNSARQIANIMQVVGAELRPHSNHIESAHDARGKEEKGRIPLVTCSSRRDKWQLDDEGPASRTPIAQTLSDLT